MKKKVKAVRPYIYEGKINFKHKPYDAWVALGGKTGKSHYPPRYLHCIVYKWGLPQLMKSKNEARLRFMQPYSMNFDAFPDYARYEIIPFFWDVWPDNIEKVVEWIRKHSVKTAFFTSSQVADKMSKILKGIEVHAVTEGIDISSYKEGKILKERSIDFLEYGREIDAIVKYNENGINYVHGKRNGKILFSLEQLHTALADAKVVATYPKSWTNPEEAGGIETLTQRYWECMLSRCVMIGHAPKELIDLLGYNPVVELDRNDPDAQLRDVLLNIHGYQNLVDENRKNAIIYGDWKYSIGNLMNILSKKARYEISR